MTGPLLIKNLRYGPTYKDKIPATHFKFENDGGFSRAVHTCTGVGECRKLNGMTMCPSFRATRDELDSPRGRANTLRLVLAGKPGTNKLTNEGLLTAMDLCLSCKACKQECPSSVDIAKMKSEVLQAKYDAGNISLREKLIGRSADDAKKFSGFPAPLINTIQHSKLGKTLIQNFTNIDSRRDLPPYAKKPFLKQIKHNLHAIDESSAIVLFADTYMNYYEPWVGHSALNMLKALGKDVIIIGGYCCQRPRISNGFLRQAKKEGEKTAHYLNRYIKKGLPIIVCEPSCASALKDDLPDLLDNRSVAHELSKATFTLEDYVVNNFHPEKINLLLRSLANEISHHGHCHEKALFNTDNVQKVFNAIDGVKLSQLDSGCCGMAGSFGYEVEHYRLSIKIAEQSLAELLSKNRNTTVVANGFSCRHQIKHCFDIQARHWGRTNRH